MQDSLASAPPGFVDLLSDVASVSCRLSFGSLTFVMRLQIICQKFEDSRPTLGGYVLTSFPVTFGL